MTKPAPVNVINAYMMCVQTITCRVVMRRPADRWSIGQISDVATWGAGKVLLRPTCQKEPGEDFGKGYSLISLFTFSPIQMHSPSVILSRP